MERENNLFKLYVPLTKSNSSNYSVNENGSLNIEGIASTTNQDLQKDIILPSAIESMKKQLLTVGKNLHGDHKPFLFDGLLGAINKVNDSEDNNSLNISATILSKYAPDIKEMLDIGVNLGFSIGGAATDFEINKDNGLNVSDVFLHEISLTAMPANLDTLGTVKTSKGIVEGKCLTGICNQLTKNIKNEEEISMTDEFKNNENEGQDDVEAKIVSAINELWAEKEQSLIESVTNNIKVEIKNIVQEEINKQKNEDEDKPEENNQEEQTEKGLDYTQLGEIISKSVSSEMANFQNNFFKDLNEQRNPNSHLDLRQQEEMFRQQEQNPSNQIGKTYSTKETAEILMKKQRSVNPVVATALQNI